MEKNFRGKYLLPKVELLIFLRYIATGTFMDVLGDVSRISKSTVWRAIHRVMHAVLMVKSKYIKFSTNYEENASEFFKVQGFPGVVGCIDGSQIPILVPMNEHSETFRCRKGFFSINAQMICGPHCEIYDVVTSWPGSAHDANIWTTCKFKANFDASNINSEYHLLGDSAYPLTVNLMTPYRNATTPLQRKFNYKHSATRMAIEKLYGQLKRRFALLKCGLRFKKVEDSANCIVAIAIIFNICKKEGDNGFDDDYEQEEHNNASNFFQNSLGSNKRNQIAQML